MSPPRRSRPARRGRGPLAGLGGVLLAIAAGVGLFVYGLEQRLSARAAFPPAEGRLEVEGLDAPLDIFRDRNGVAHVEAGSEADAFFGLGFVHAQDRLAQMSWLVRTARGRTAEIVGPAGVEADRLARLLDLGGLAEAELVSLDPHTRELLDAYSRGVNARIGRIRADHEAPPVTMTRARMPLEDWEPADSLAIEKLYAWGLSGTLDVTLVLSDLVEHLGGYAARRFFPRSAFDDEPEGGDPGVTAGLGAGFARSALVPDPLRRAAHLEGRAVGSSAWVVGGAQTRSGRPILVADSHLPPTAPPLLHVDHIRGGELDVAGATLPGLPLFWTGTNPQVAWASTHARAVTTDLYVETLHPSDPTRYHDGRGWRALAERTERIRVRGDQDEVLTVRSTGHGPLIRALVDEGRAPLSLAWVGARIEGGSSLESFLQVARARDAEALVRALETHHEPPLAVAYADRGGAFGVQVAGWIPRREYTTALVPLPGRARWYEWRGRVPFEQLPRARGERGRGWVVAADNPWGQDPQQPRIEWLWRTGERAERLDALLSRELAAGPVGLREMAALQSDVGAARARSLVRRALELARAEGALGVEAREVVKLLEDWEGEAGARSVGAAIYHVFLGRLTEKLFARRLGEDLMRRYVALPQVDPAQVVLELLDAAARGDTGGWEEVSQVREAVRASLRETWFQLSFALGPNRARWHWGRLHALRFAPFGPRVGGAGRDSGLGPFPSGGNGGTINAAEYAPGGSFDVRVASTWRFAVDAGTLDEALIALAPGQSEHPRHPHFGDGLERWLGGQPSLLATSPLLVEESSSTRLALIRPGAGS